ncbi:uncharacterized protein [Dermacentor albipictus]|uniref:uncharacterized protein isoform X2 n=1 Tax=Dermacentor albipictus TaxID=60249 RepID=UPI0031FD970A
MSDKGRCGTPSNNPGSLKVGSHSGSRPLPTEKTRVAAATAAGGSGASSVDGKGAPSDASTNRKFAASSPKTKSGSHMVSTNTISSPRDAPNATKSSSPFTGKRRTASPETSVAGTKRAKKGSGATSPKSASIGATITSTAATKKDATSHAGSAKTPPNGASTTSTGKNDQAPSVSDAPGTGSARSSASGHDREQSSAEEPWSVEASSSSTYTTETAQPILQRRRGEAYVPPGWFKPRESRSSEEMLESGTATSSEASGSKSSATSRSASSWMRRIAGGEGKLSARHRCCLCVACCALVVCVASAAALAVAALLRRGDSAWDHGCRTSFCVRARELMQPPPGAPRPCDDFYSHVCYASAGSHMDFLEAFRLRRKTEYHESELADPLAAPTGDVSHKLAYAHQVCAQFSHRQNPSLRTLASQMRQSLEGDMKSFLEARSEHDDTMLNLTWAAVRMGINTLFNVTEVNASTPLHIYARMPDQYYFGQSDKNKLLVYVDNLLRHLWRNKATDSVLQAIVELVSRLSEMTFGNDARTQVTKLEDYVLPPGNFNIGAMIVKSVPPTVNLRHNVRAVIVHGDVISRAYAILASEARETANLFLLVLFFDEYLKMVTGWSQKTFDESLSCTLLGSKLFPLQYGHSEAALFYDQTAARELRDIFSAAKVTAEGHLGVRGQPVEVNIKILEPNSFPTDAVDETSLYQMHALNILEGLKATMTAMLRRVAEGTYGGESRILVEAQFRGAFAYDPTVSSLLVATQNLRPPFYCHQRTASNLPLGTNATAVSVQCDGGKFKPFLNHGLAATAMVEAVLSVIIQKSIHNATEIEERASCYKKQLKISGSVDTATLASTAMGLSLSFSMLKTANMALWRDLNLLKEDRAALRLFFHRHCLRHCGKTGTLTGKHKCHLALVNMREFFTAYGCRNNAPMRPTVHCAI